jgi:hypothetical protein
MTTVDQRRAAPTGEPGYPDTPHDLLDWCGDHGIILLVDGGDLVVDGPESLLTDAFLKRLRRHKAHLIALTAPPWRLSPPGCACRICGGDSWWERPRGGWVCRWCHPPPRGVPTYPRKHWQPASAGNADSLRGRVP